MEVKSDPGDGDMQPLSAMMAYKSNSDTGETQVPPYLAIASAVLFQGGQKWCHPFLRRTTREKNVQECPYQMAKTPRQNMCLNGTHMIGREADGGSSIQSFAFRSAMFSALAKGCWSVWRSSTPHTLCRILRQMEKQILGKF